MAKTRTRINQDSKEMGPETHMVCGVKRLESCKHWEAMAWEARFRAGLKATERGREGE